MSNRFKLTLVIIFLALLGSIVIIFYDIRHTYIELGSIKQELSQIKIEFQHYQSLAVKVNDIDNKFTQEFANAKAENDRLHNDVINGIGRLQLNLSPRPNNTATTASMDDAKACELTGEARQNYYLLRNDIITKDNTILGLQEYITQVCLTD